MLVDSMRERAWLKKHFQISISNLKQNKEEEEYSFPVLSRGGFIQLISLVVLGAALGVLLVALGVGVVLGGVGDA